jgi:hypothetical protein
MPDFILHIKDGSITNKVIVRRAFSSLNDGKYLVRIDAFKKRTLNQNAYYHCVVVPMVQQGLYNAGYSEVKTNDDAHEILKHLFLKKNITNHKTEEQITIAGSTATLKTIEFNMFLEDIWKWASEYLNVVIPAPNEQLVMFNKPAIAEYDYDLKTTIVE